MPDENDLEQLSPEDFQPDSEFEDLAEASLEDQLRNEIATATEERDELREQLLRTMADLQNFRKRVAEERLQSQKFASADLMRELLPVLDNFQRTLQSADSGASVESLAEGVRLTDRLLRQTLESKGLKQIASVGQAFDPAYHEAIGTEPASDAFPAESITAEIEAGYCLADRVLRPARVRVAR